MSADTQPISPSRFAAALKELSPAMLHLKIAEIRNSIAHLQYSNDQLRPFAEGSATALGGQGNEPDQDCVEAIRENEAVIERMAERIAIVRAEVEYRGMSWDEFRLDKADDGNNDEPDHAAIVNGDGSESDHPAWSDGTFQTGILADILSREGQVVAPAGAGTEGRRGDQQPRTTEEQQQQHQGNQGLSDGGHDDANDGMHL